jgi:hypothetical protein
LIVLDRTAKGHKHESRGVAKRNIYRASRAQSDLILKEICNSRSGSS